MTLNTQNLKKTVFDQFPLICIYDWIDFVDGEFVLNAKIWGKIIITIKKYGQVEKYREVLLVEQNGELKQSPFPYEYDYLNVKYVAQTICRVLTSKNVINDDEDKHKIFKLAVTLAQSLLDTPQLFLAA